MKRLILVGGASGSGKSTTSKVLANELGAGWLQIDTIWVAAQEALADDPEKSHLLQVDRRVIEAREPIPDLVTQEIAAGQFVCSLLPRVFWTELQRHDVVVADGAWLLPEFVAGLKIENADVRSAFLHEADPDEVRKALDGRRVNQTWAHWHEPVAAMKWTYGNWLAGEARRLGLAVVEARPRETLVSRVRAALSV
ncbi:MAG: hypothetical protein AB7J35_00860 [Dehalococcoidia bacterium]